MADTHLSRRHILLDGQAHFRDLGGHKTSNDYDEILQEFISMDGYIQDGFGLNQKELS